MNKKLFSIFSVFFLGAILVSCGKGTSNNSTDTTPSASDTSVSEPSVVTPSTDTSNPPSTSELPSASELPSTSTSTSNSSSSSVNPDDVVIPDGMVAVNFCYNYPGDKTYFKVVPYTPGDKVAKLSLFDQPMRTGYMFSGWYEDRYCMKPFDFENTIVPKNGLDIFAGWNVFDADPLGDQAIEDPYTEKNYKITYTSGPGFSYVNPDGALVLTADAGDVIKFKLAIGIDYEGTPVVKANNDTLTANQGIYSHTVTGNTTFTVSGIVKSATPEPDKNLVSWYFCGEGSLWGADGWSTAGGVQLYENPDNPDDKGQYLGITFEVGDTFKVTDGSTWFGYEMIDPWVDPANAGKSHFAAVNDGYGGSNIQCKIAGTFDVYVNGSGKLWIQLSAK